MLFITQQFPIPAGYLPPLQAWPGLTAHLAKN